MGLLGTILMVVGWIGSIIFFIQILIHAFKRSVGWGIASLLIPIVSLVWAAKHWDELKKPTLMMIGFTVLAMLGSALSFAGMFSSAMSEGMTPVQ
jgi:hypothetical protein